MCQITECQDVVVGGYIATFEALSHLLIQLAPTPHLNWLLGYNHLVARIPPLLPVLAQQG